MQYNKWAGKDVTHYQICCTDEDNLQECFNNISWYIEKQIEAGKTVGVDLNSIDIAQGDNFEHCECQSCGEEKLELLDSYYQEIYDNLEYVGFNPQNMWGFTDSSGYSR